MEAKELILKTSVQLAAEGGVKELTIDKVAVKAGMSKGGVFYHYKTKDDLLLGMVNYIIDQFESESQRLVEQGMDCARASIHASFTDSIDQKERIMAMIATVAHDHTIMAKTRERYQDWIDHIQSSGCTRDIALLIVTAIDGFFVSSAFGMSSDPQAERIILRDRLLRLLEEDENYWYVQAFRVAIAKMEAEELVLA